MLQPGDTFGDYRVLKLLGKGGMGFVFLLENAGGAQVAAKILDPAEAGDREARKRFLREAQLALGVRHPNLVETYDVGEDPETGFCYILMEYVPGGSLADRIKAGPLPINDAIRIVYQIASVLELAREKGIVHRDIKPGNIMFGADGKAKLADLGIARGGIGGADTTTVTQTGMMIGTPAYMAPEQMLDAHHVDCRADIYSLGIVFYEMLTGKRPNHDDTVVQLMAKAVAGEPIPDVRTLRPEVSASVAELVSLMCAMKADERISTPVEVTTAISQIVHGREVTVVRKRPRVMAKVAPPRPSGDRARLLATCAFAVVALVGIGAFVYLGAPRHVPPKTDPLATVPVVQTSVVERVVERPVVRTVVRTSVVERVDTRTRVVTQALTKADKMQLPRRTDDTEGRVVPGNLVITNIPGLPDDAGSVKVVGLAIAGELDADALRQLRFTDVSEPTSIPYGKRVLLKIEYDLPADGSIYISVSWRCARPEPAQTFSGANVRLLGGSSYCRGRGTLYQSMELLDAGESSTVREIRVHLQNNRPMSPKGGRLASAWHPIPVNLEFKARDDGWTSVRDAKSDADVESVLNEHVKKSFTINRCDLNQALEVLKRCADDRIAFECDGTVDKNMTVDYGSNMTTVDGRRMTFRQVVADVCKMVNCKFRVADRKVVLFREPGRDAVRTRKDAPGKQAKAKKTFDPEQLKDADSTRAVQKALDAVFPGWKVSVVDQQGDDSAAWAIGYQPSWRGGEDVVTTMPPSMETPTVLSRRVELGKGHPVLNLEVASQNVNVDFVLSVRVNGKTALEPRLICTPEDSPYARIQVPLSAYRGRKVLIEIVHTANNWSYEHAFWKKIEIAEGTGKEDTGLVGVKRVEVFPAANPDNVKWLRRTPWRYTEKEPGESWKAPSFDDSRWRKSAKAFGRDAGSRMSVAERWQGERIWLRRSFSWNASEPVYNAVFNLSFDQDVEIFLNGTPVLKRDGWNTGWDLHAADRAAFARALRPGENVLAVTVKGDGPSFFDCGLVVETLDRGLQDAKESCQDKGRVIPKRRFAPVSR